LSAEQQQVLMNALDVINVARERYDLQKHLMMLASKEASPAIRFD
jgi:hypothetical protein